MITIEQYFMGRDEQFPDECTATIRLNAAETVRRTNQLKQLAAIRDEFVFVEPEVASGWRPLAVNDATSHAATHSRHITAEALDTHDPERLFARWCLRNLNELEQIGLWMEDPRWTPHWVHLQTVPPLSGHRVYIPSVSPPLAVALPEQKTGEIQHG
jgi:hypothetical protein